MVASLRHVAACCCEVNPYLQEKFSRPSFALAYSIRSRSGVKKTEVKRSRPACSVHDVIFRSSCWAAARQKCWPEWNRVATVLCTRVSDVRRRAVLLEMYRCLSLAALPDSAPCGTPPEPRPFFCRLVQPLCHHSFCFLSNINSQVARLRCWLCLQVLFYTVPGKSATIFLPPTLPNVARC